MGWLEMECPESSVMLRRESLHGFERMQGVRVAIVAKKSVKAGGAKGGRKMNARRKV